MNTIKINQDPNPTVIDLITGTKYKLLSYKTTSEPYGIVGVDISMLRGDGLIFNTSYSRYGGDKAKFKINLNGKDLLL